MIQRPRESSASPSTPQSSGASGAGSARGRGGVSCVRLTIGAHPQRRTDATDAAKALGPLVRVLFVEWVTAKAVGPRGLSRCDRLATQKIHALLDWLHVRGIRSEAR